MVLLNYILVKVPFMEQVKKEFQGIIDLFEEFFEMLKAITYDKLVDLWGVQTTNMLLIGVGVVILMIVLTKIITQ